MALFEALGEAEPDPLRRLHAAETLAFTAQECGGDRTDLYRRAAEAADGAGETWKSKVYRQQARDGFRPVFGEAPIGRQVEVPEDCAGFVLGESSIRVDASSRVGVQVERTVRDWISYQMSYDLGAEVPPAGTNCSTTTRARGCGRSCAAQAPR